MARKGPTRKGGPVGGNKKGRGKETALTKRKVKADLPRTGKTP